MSLKEDIKELLTFTKGEKKGIIVLIFLVIIVILINQYAYLFYNEEAADYNKYKNEIAEFEQSLFPVKEKYSVDSYIDNKYDTLQLFNFNPNINSEKDWKLLGLSDKQIKIIGNYLKKGGKFKYKTDLQKIYGISQYQFQKLYPFINLPEKTDYYEYDYKNTNNKLSENNKSEYEIPEVAEYFEFNPNLITNEEWKKLGFSQKQISTIRNYLNKGGKFYKTEDLKKIYGIQDFQFERIKEYIKIPINENVEKNERDVNVNQKVDINSLSVDEMKTKGKFWKYNATRIVKYRNLLGGFYKKEQLLEVYGLKIEYYLKVADDIIIDKSKLEKININFAEVSELGRHPYISYEDAKKVLEFRNKNGFIKDLKILEEKKIITPDVFRKISPYLKVK